MSEIVDPERPLISKMYLSMFLIQFCALLNLVDTITFAFWGHWHWTWMLYSICIVLLVLPTALFSF